MKKIESGDRPVAVGQQLPDLVGDVQAAVRPEAEPQRQALREASKLYQLVRTWTKRVDEHELSLVAADRAVSCALEADDPDVASAAAWNLAMILSAQGHTAEARGVVRRAIEALRHAMHGATQVRLAVWGSLHLLAATTAAREDRDDEAGQLHAVRGTPIDLSARHRALLRPSEE